MRAARSFKGRIAAGEFRANSAEARDREMLEKMCELRAFVGGLNRTINTKRARVVGRLDAELVCVQYVINVALLESEGTVSELMCDMRAGFHAKTSSDAPSQSAGVLQIRRRSSSLYDLFSCLAFGNVVDISF